VSAEQVEQQVSPNLPEKRFRLDIVLIALIVIAIFGASIYALKEKEAFPEASIDLKLSKREILDRTLDWARKLNFRKDKLITSTGFSFDNDAKNYLELELGQKRANELMKSEIPMWWWRTRLCKEFDQDQFYTLISPTGKLICLSNTLQNDKALPSVTQDQAKEIARDFVEKQAGIPLTDYTIVTNSTSSLPHRKDHDFTWEDRKHAYGDAYLRVSVTISGNQVSYFYYYLHVPEVWERKFSTIRSYNELLGRIAFVFNSFLMFAGTFILVWAITSRNARWRMGAVFGLFIFLGCIAMFLNDWSSIIEGYQTQTPFRSYMISAVAKMVASSFGVGLIGVFFIMAGEAMYRASNPMRVAFENYFKFRPFTTLELSKGLLVGICVFCIALGWVVTYYIIGSHFGYWCPLDFSDYQILSAGVPAYTAVCIGVEAAINEEFLYRVIGLSLAKRLVRNFWLANLMQAAAWGFAHSNYPQEPPYARGIELTLSGLFFGWIMNRFGLLPCLVAHYLLDAFLTAQPLLTSGKPGLVVEALVPILPFPLLAIFAIARARKKPDLEEPLLNEHLIHHKEPVPEEEQERRHFDYVAMPRRTRLILAAVMAVFMATGLVFTQLVQDKRIGTEKNISSTRTQVIRKAWDILAAHGVRAGTATSGWQASATLTDELQYEQLQYLFEKLGFSKTNELALASQKGYYWRVRFFKPMQAEEYEVDLDEKGNELEFDTTLEEDQPGATLTEAQARTLADKYIAQIYPNYKPEFDSTTKVDRRHRTDYSFIYKLPSQKAPDAEAKISIQVKGNEISELARYWELPDQWKFERSKRTARDTVFDTIRAISAVAMIVLMLWWAIGLLRTGYFPFRPALIFGGAMALLYIPDALNGLIDVLMSYHTTMPMSSFFINQIVQVVEILAAKFGQYALIMLLALPCARILAPGTNPLSVLTATLRPSAEERGTHRDLWTDAAILSYSLIAFTFGSTAIITWVRALVSPAVQFANLGGIEALANVFFPSLSIINDALSSGISMLLMVPICAGLYAKYLKRFWIYMLFGIVSLCITYSGERYWQEFLVDVISGLVSLPVAWLIVARLARQNMLAYIMFGILTSIFGRLPAIFVHGMRLFSTEAIASIGLLLLPAVYVLILNLRKKPIAPEDIIAEV
jgi:hypothetical protein